MVMVMIVVNVIVLVMMEHVEKVLNDFVLMLGVVVIW